MTWLFNFKVLAVILQASTYARSTVTTEWQERAVMMMATQQIALAIARRNLAVTNITILLTNNLIIKYVFTIETYCNETVKFECKDCLKGMKGIECCKEVGKGRWEKRKCENECPDWDDDCSYLNCTLVNFNCSIEVCIKGSAKTCCLKDEESDCNEFCRQKNVQCGEH